MINVKDIVSNAARGLVFNSIHNFVKNLVRISFTTSVWNAVWDVNNPVWNLVMGSWTLVKFSLFNSQCNLQQRNSIIKELIK